MAILKVNGTEHQVNPGARMLLEVLRDDLHLGGAREGCGIGMCGACTVLVEGKPISSCIVLAAQVVGKEITTVEGLAHDGKLHAVQQSFIDEGGFQCAFCTSGFILSAVALLNEIPVPSEDDVRDYLSGNLCRCGSYKNILKAVMRASRA